jgi:hypothetical protein
MQTSLPCDKPLHATEQTFNASDELLLDLLSAPLAAETRASGQILTGHLHGIDDEGRILFVPEQGGAEAIPVAIGVALSDGVLVPAARNHQRALVVRTTENPNRMILIGLVRERVNAAARDAAPGQLEVKVDGEKVQLTAESEIELKCGKASLILRQSGRVILKGTYIVTSASGPVKIKGATIALN